MPNLLPSRKSVLVIASWLLGMAICLVSCTLPKAAGTPEFVELSPQVIDEIDVQAAHYSEATWLPSGDIALFFSPGGENPLPLAQSFGVYRPSSREWRNVSLPDFVPNCSRGTSNLSFPASVRDGMVFMYTCSDNGISGSLYLWNEESQEFDLLRQYAIPFFPGNAAVFDEGNEWLQHERDGPGLSDKLHRVRRDGDMMRLFPDFARVGRPAIRPDGKSVAFVGNSGREGQDGEMDSWSEIEGFFRTPWDLYLMDANGENVRIFFPKLGNPYQLTWSSDGSKLFFAGSRPNVKGGIWVLDMDTLETWRLWTENTSFSLSPDQDQMVIIDQRTADDGSVTTVPVIINLPDEVRSGERTE